MILIWRFQYFVQNFNVKKGVCVFKKWDRYLVKKMTRHQQKFDFRTPFGVVFQEKKNHRSEIITVKELNFRNKLDLEQYRKLSIFGKIFAFAWKNTPHTYVHIKWI